MTYYAWALNAYSFLGWVSSCQHEGSAVIPDAHMILSVTVHAALRNFWMLHLFPTRILFAKLIRHLIKALFGFFG